METMENRRRAMDKSIERMLTAETANILPTDLPTALLFVSVSHSSHSLGDGYPNHFNDYE